jgi:MacB-like periplasmic core domain
MIGYLLRGLAARWRNEAALILLTLASVALGVASVVAIQLLHKSAIASFAAGMKAVDGEIDLSIVPDGPALPEDVWRVAIADPDVALALPVLEITVKVRGEARTYLDLYATDLTYLATLPWRDAAPDLVRAFTTPNFVGLTQGMARRLRVDAGDRVEVSLGSRDVTLTVGGVLDFAKRPARRVRHRRRAGRFRSTRRTRSRRPAVARRRGREGRVGADRFAVAVGFAGVDAETTRSSSRRFARSLPREPHCALVRVGAGRDVPRLFGGPRTGGAPSRGVRALARVGRDPRRRRGDRVGGGRADCGARLCVRHSARLRGRGAQRRGRVGHVAESLPARRDRGARGAAVVDPARVAGRNRRRDTRGDAAAPRSRARRSALVALRTFGRAADRSPGAATRRARRYFPRVGLRRLPPARVRHEVVGLRARRRGAGCAAAPVAAPVHARVRALRGRRLRLRLRRACAVAAPPASFPPRRCRPRCRCCSASR